MIRKIVLLVTVAMAIMANADLVISKESAKALGVTRGKKFSSGLVFVNGKIIMPPYTVERWGAGIRINAKPVTGEVIPWSDFLKTQEGVKVTKSEPAAPAVADGAAETESDAAAATEEDEDDSSLDDLFDDDPKPAAKKAEKGKANAKKPSSAVRKPAAQSKTVETVKYSLEGEFVSNDATKGYVKRINGLRTDIDRSLRSGGFICFGERYPQVSGDIRMTKKILKELPGLMKNAESAASFRSAVRSAGFYFFTDELCDDIYRYRYDYLRLQELNAQREKDERFENLINGK